MKKKIKAEKYLKLLKNNNTIQENTEFTEESERSQTLGSEEQ